MPAANRNFAPSPFVSVLRGFGAVAARDAGTRIYRCGKCGAHTRVDADDARESVACWAADRGVLCTGRAVPL